jgi:hypothetical protein
MANDLEDPGDVSSMMEALWGPRAESPVPAHTDPARRPNADQGRGTPDDVLRSERDQEVHEELALLEEWERESAERLATLESAVGSEVQRLSVAVEASRAGMASTADLEVLRTELAHRMAAGQAELRADLEADMVEQLGLVLDEALKQGDARHAVVGAELNRGEETPVGREEFVALRSELRDALSRHMSAAQAELQRRVTLLDSAIADARAQMAERLDQMATLVSTEAARATVRVTDAAALRDDDLRTLKEQVDQISTVVAGLHRRFPAS